MRIDGQDMWDEVGGGLLVGCKSDVGMWRMGAGLAREGWVERDGADVCLCHGRRKGVWVLVCVPMVLPVTRWYPPKRLGPFVDRCGL